MQLNSDISLESILRALQAQKWHVQRSRTFGAAWCTPARPQAGSRGRSPQMGSPARSRRAQEAAKRCRGYLGGPQGSLVLSAVLGAKNRSGCLKRVFDKSRSPTKPFRRGPVAHPDTKSLSAQNYVRVWWLSRNLWT